jgi:hypothetical protein
VGSGWPRRAHLSNTQAESVPKGLIGTYALLRFSRFARRYRGVYVTWWELKERGLGFGLYNVLKLQNFIFADSWIVMSFKNCEILLV